MRVRPAVVLMLGLGLAVAGCGPKKSYDGPTVDKFVGRLTHDGQPVSFPEGEKVMLTVFHETGESFGIRIKPDGSFEVGWMPIGRYSAILNRESNQGGGPSRKYTVLNGLNIEAGKTEYTIELGKDWRP